MSPSNHDTKLAADLRTILQKQYLADVVFTFVPSNEQIQAHRMILCARSPVFLAMFLNANTAEAQQGRVEICDISPGAFKEMLHYIYTGDTPNLEQLAEELFIAADKYELDELKSLCEQSLCSRLSADSAVALYQLASAHNAPMLKSKALDFIASAAKGIIDAMKSEPEQLLKTLEQLTAKKVDARDS